MDPDQLVFDDDYIAPGKGDEVKPAADVRTIAESEAGFGWLMQKVKETSLNVAEVYKRDLGIFARTVREDVRAAAAVAEEEVQSIERRSFESSVPADDRSTFVRGEQPTPRSLSLNVLSGVLGTKSFISGLLVDEEKAPVKPHVLSAGMARRIEALQKDPATFLVDPQDPSFIDYLEGFRKGVHGYTDQISAILSASSQIAAMHKNLVPVQLSYPHFWARYFFRVSRITEAADRRHQIQEALLTRAETEENLTWDDDGDDDAASASDVAACEVDSSGVAVVFVNDTQALDSEDSAQPSEAASKDNEAVENGAKETTKEVDSEWTEWE